MIPQAFVPFDLPAQTAIQDVAFSSDARMLYLTRRDGTKLSIVSSTENNGTWSSPITVSFSGTWRDLEETLSDDGNEMIFASNRPAGIDTKPIDGFFGGQLRPGVGGNLWITKRDGATWSAPTRLPDAINSSNATFSPALAPDGTLYFMHPSGANGKFHLFVAKPEHGEYRSASLAPFSDEAYSDVDPTVSPDGTCIVFTSSRPPALTGTQTLFITFYRNGTWTTPQEIGSGFNPAGNPIEARFSRDGRTLYYSTDGHLMQVNVAIPALYAPAILTDALSPNFSPNGTTMLFTRSVGTRSVIFQSHGGGQGWSSPTIVPFSHVNDSNDMDPVYSPDGSYVVFASTRPMAGSARTGAHLWRVARTKTGWGTPSPLPDIVNVSDAVFAPSIARDGALYFLRSNAARAHLLMSSSLKNGAYTKAQPLGFSTVATHDADPQIAADKSFVIFASSGRSGAQTAQHLFIVFANNGGWNQPTPLRYLGDDASDRSSDGSPTLSPDGRTLYFTRGSNVYSIPLDALFTQNGLRTGHPAI